MKNQQIKNQNGSIESDPIDFTNNSNPLVTNLINKKRQLLWAVIVFALLWPAYKIFMALQFFGVLPHSAAITRAKEVISISDFSPDGSKLYLDYCDTNRRCNIGQYDLGAQKTSLFIPQGTQDAIASPSSSDDGKQLVMVIKEAVNNYETSQIGILDLGKNTYRAVTKSSTFKEWPSFSHDGKKIIYAQANRKRESGKTRYSEWDIYEMVIATGAERRLTDFCFFIVDRPQYLEDNERFVFSGEAPGCNYPKLSRPGSRANYTLEDYKTTQEGRAAYKKLYQDNTIFMMTSAEATLKPMFMNGSFSDGAVVTRDGKIFFKSITNAMDGIKCCKFNYDLFNYDDGVINRITHLKTYLSGFTVSAKGDYIVYLSDIQRNNNNELWMMDVKAGTYSELNIGGRSAFSLIYVVNESKTN
jgi:Tol biopolymer transport system component